jgi:hypothetical protein
MLTWKNTLTYLADDAFQMPGFRAGGHEGMVRSLGFHIDNFHLSPE